MPSSSPMRAPEEVQPEADGKVLVQGIAYTGADGELIKAVEVSTNDGASWHTATLLREEVLPDDARAPHHWLRWVARVPPSGASAESCCCRAVDVHGESQPRVSEKHRGYLYNGWFHVPFTIAPKKRERVPWR